MSPQTIAHYRINGKLGEGSMGKVYRAFDHKLDREVAIKVIHEKFVGDQDRLARFAREARVLASLNHPNKSRISNGIGRWPDAGKTAVRRCPSCRGGPTNLQSFSTISSSFLR